MAKEPVDATERILRQIQETQAEHGRLLHGMSKRLDEVRNGVIAALGLAKNADVRHDSVQNQLEELRRRVEALEAKI